jgi:peptidoglycan hydrolase CwlO-like protein
MNDSRLIIKAIVDLKKDLVSRINQVETKLGSRINQVETKLGAKIDDTNQNLSDLRKETKQGFQDINNRADLLGKQLNALDEDAPVGEEFAKLVKRVDKLVKYQNFATV